MLHPPYSNLHPTQLSTPLGSSSLLWADAQAGLATLSTGTGCSIRPQPHVTCPGAKPSIPVSCLELGTLGVKFFPSIRCPDFEV